MQGGRENVVEDLGIVYTSVGCSEEHYASGPCNDVRILVIVCPKYICLLHDQPAHRVCNKYDGLSTKRNIVFRRGIGEYQHLKEKIFGKVDDVEVGTCTFEIRIVTVGKYPLPMEALLLGQPFGPEIVLISIPRPGLLCGTPQAMYKDDITVGLRAVADNM